MSMTHATSALIPRAGNFAHPHTNVAHIRIEPGMTVADFGAGSGAYVFAIAAALAGEGVVYAIDAQKELLRRIHNEALQRHFTNVSVLWSDLEKKEGSKLARASCDVVLMSNILFQVEQKEALLREAHRILKPTGKLAIIDWTDSFNNMGPVKSAVITREAGLALAQKEGFELVQEFNAGAHHWGAVFTPQTL